MIIMQEAANKRLGALRISAQETQIQVKPRVFQGSEIVQV